DVAVLFLRVLQVVQRPRGFAQGKIYACDSGGAARAILIRVPFQLPQKQQGFVAASAARESFAGEAFVFEPVESIQRLVASTRRQICPAQLPISASNFWVSLHNLSTLRDRVVITPGVVQDGSDQPAGRRR